MANIKVDYSKFSEAVNEIESYVGVIKSKMDSAQSKVSSMAASWNGGDYQQFKIQWDDLRSNDSTYSKMIKELTEYANLLKYAENEYRNAQIDAINRANWLTW